jgi:Fe-S cluster biogenesis protein NfuA
MTTISETDQELETLAQQVDAAWSEVQKLADGDRSKATDLRQAIEAFHKAGLTRIVRRLKEDPQGKALLFELVDDPLVYALFSMHGIVRADLTTRVSRVVDMVRPYMRSHGGDVELAEVRGTTAFVRLSGACNGCSMSAVTLRNTVEEALREHVPEITAVEVVPNEPGPALIMPDAIGVAGGRVGWVQGLPLADVPPGTMRSFEHNGTSADRQP